MFVTPPILFSVTSISTGSPRSEKSLRTSKYDCERCLNQTLPECTHFQNSDLVALALVVRRIQHSRLIQEVLVLMLTACEGGSGSTTSTMVN